MILHKNIGNNDVERKRKLKMMIHSNEIVFGGNVKLKIYGTLNCASGKKIKMENRIFFASEEEAIALGYRPCGHCLNNKYRCWKN
ncbi:MAG TPA: Ada metal-binding domain-containing protein [Puia sp.]|nr:Ada metal-binding domain-containing protein [Puia sp.]